eukprot:TRINITY_DN20261_c0_g1_i1.p1 TRINITY_DN20261_c0_g1~~TRINITY_DN20261_c0_g1_i1.p1  ORF type:complete len:407 (-),score=134.91 TRINITY_DN20261_c0_g1_i1:210-1430(-)
MADTDPYAVLRVTSSFCKSTAYKVLSLFRIFRYVARQEKHTEVVSELLPALGLSLAELRAGLDRKDGDTPPRASAQFSFDVFEAISSEMGHVASDDEWLASVTSDADDDSDTSHGKSIGLKVQTAGGISGDGVGGSSSKGEGVADGTDKLDFVEGGTMPAKKRRTASTTPAASAPQIYQITNSWAFRVVDCLPACAIDKGPHGYAVFTFEDGDQWTCESLLYEQARNPKSAGKEVDTGSQAKKATDAAGGKKAGAKAGAKAAKRPAAAPKAKVQAKAAVTLDPQVTQDKLKEMRKKCSKDYLPFITVIERRPKLSHGGWVVVVQDRAGGSQKCSEQSTNGRRIEDVVDDMNKKCKDFFQELQKDATEEKEIADTLVDHETLAQPELAPGLDDDKDGGKGDTIGDIN